MTQPTRKPDHCHARSDWGDPHTMSCSRCGYQWDVNDAERPQCKSWPEVVRERHGLKRGCKTCSNG